MQKGDLMMTPTGKTGPVIGFPRFNRPGSNGRQRIQLLVECAIEGRDPIIIRAAYDPRDLEEVTHERS